MCISPDEEALCLAWFILSVVFSYLVTTSKFRYFVMYSKNLLKLIDNLSLQFLNKWPCVYIEDIYNKHYLWYIKCSQEFGFDPLSIWVPVLEKDFGQERFLSIDPVTAVKEGKMHAIPYIVSQTTDEFYWKAFSKFYNIAINEMYYWNVWYCLTRHMTKSLMPKYLKVWLLSFLPVLLTTIYLPKPC